MKKQPLIAIICTILACLTIVITLASFNVRLSANGVDKYNNAYESAKKQTKKTIDHKRVIDNTKVDTKTFFKNIDLVKSSEKTILDIYSKKDKDDSDLPTLNKARDELATVLDKSQWENDSGILIKNYRTDNLTIEATYAPKYSPENPQTKVTFMFNYQDKPVYVLNCTYDFTTGQFIDSQLLETSQMFPYVKSTLK